MKLPKDFLEKVKEREITKDQFIEGNQIPEQKKEDKDYLEYYKKKKEIKEDNFNTLFNCIKEAKKIKTEDMRLIKKSKNEFGKYGFILYPKHGLNDDKESNAAIKRRFYEQIKTNLKDQRFIDKLPILKDASERTEITKIVEKRIKEAKKEEIGYLKRFKKSLYNFWNKLICEDSKNVVVPVNNLNNMHNNILK